MVQFKNKDLVSELLKRGVIAYRKQKKIKTQQNAIYELSLLVGCKSETIKRWIYASSNNQVLGATNEAFIPFIWLLLTKGTQSENWLRDVFQATDLSVVHFESTDLVQVFKDIIIDGKSLSKEDVIKGLNVISSSTYQPEVVLDDKYSSKKRLSLYFIVILTLGLPLSIFIILSSYEWFDPTNQCNTLNSRYSSQFDASQGLSTYTIENGLLSNQIRKIGLNEYGLWVGYRPGENGIDGISRFDRENWMHCGGILLEENQNINDFLFIEDEIFMATDGKGVAHFNTVSENWRIFNEQSNTGILNNSVYSLSNVNNSVWASTYEGIFTFNENYWQLAYRYEEDSLTSNHVFQVLDDNQGNRWFAYLNKGIGLLDTQGEWHTYYDNDEGIQNNRGITLGQSDDVWFATDGGGVISYTSGEWSVFTVSDGLPSNNIYDIETDIYGRIWIATPEGVAYTKDRGQTWEIHHTLSTLDIEFGCSNCIYDEVHAWFVLIDVGLGHVRIPPLNNTIEVMSDLPLIQLQPSEPYIFEIEVRVVGEQLTQNDGDSLRVISDIDSLFGVYPIIAYNGEDLQTGNTYSFTNNDDPIIAPNEAGIYQIEWRVWQGRRFVSDPIVVVFEVVSDN